MTVIVKWTSRRFYFNFFIVIGYVFKGFQNQDTISFIFCNDACPSDALLPVLSDIIAEAVCYNWRSCISYLNSKYITYIYLKCNSVNFKIRENRHYPFKAEPLWFERITLIISSIAEHKKSTKFTIKL